MRGARAPRSGQADRFSAVLKRVPDALSNANTSRWSGRKLSLNWIIFPAILFVYLLFPTKNYYWDGVFFARVIEASPGLNSSLFHPNHLLYEVAGYVLYRCIRAVGLQWRAIEVLQVANSVVSVLTAYLLYLSLKRTLRSNYLVWGLTLIFAFSSTWWKFSTDANAYVFSVFFLLLAFYFTIDDKSCPLIVAVLFSIATLFHQLSVLAYPVIALALYWQSASMPSGKRKLKVAQFCVLSFLIVFTTYCCSFYLITGSLSPARFARWITSYSPDASFSFDPLSNLGYTLRGSVRLFFQGRFSMLKGLINPSVVIAMALVLMLVVALVFAVVKSKSWQDLRSLFTHLERLMTIYLLWIGIYIVFLFFWLPHNGFYRLFYLPAIVLLIGQLVRGRYDERQKPTYRLALFAAVLALSNFVFFIYPNSRVEKNPPLSLATEMNQVWTDNTVVYFQSENADINLVAYFNPKVEWRPLGSLDRLALQLKQVYGEGKSAWLEASAIDKIKASPGGHEWLAQHGRPETWREQKTPGYNLKFIQVQP